MLSQNPSFHTLYFSPLNLQHWLSSWKYIPLSVQNGLQHIMRPYAPCSSPTGKKGTISPHSWQIPEVYSACTAQISPACEPISVMVVGGAYTDNEVSQDQLSELGLKPQNHMGEDDEEACFLKGNSEHCYQEAEGNECRAVNSR